MKTEIHLLQFLVFFFKDRMAVPRYKFLVNKTNRCTELQFYWYYDSTCFRQPFCPSSGVLIRTSELVHFMQLWWPFATRSRMELVLHVSVSLSAHHQEFLAVHRLWYILCSFDDLCYQFWRPFATRSSSAESTPGPWYGRKECVTEKSSDTTGNRSRDRPARSAAP